MTMTQPDGFLAEPASGDPAGAVLVLHAWWGLNDAIRDLCRRLADAGYIAFAPDVYHGRLATTIAEAEALRGVFGTPEATAQAAADIAAAAHWLYERAGRPAAGLAVIGFSLGAYFALECSTALPDLISKVVVFYGTGPTEFDAARAAFLGHFAANDPYEEREYIDATRAALEAAGRPVTFYDYPDTGHWFFEPDRPEYDAPAAALAWERTLAFLAATQE